MRVACLIWQMKLSQYATNKDKDKDKDRDKDGPSLKKSLSIYQLKAGAIYTVI